MVDWREFLPLKDGEYVVQDWSYGVEFLVLTNQRLTYLKRLGRWWQRTRDFQVMYDIPLELIKGIEVRGVFMSKSARIFVYTGQRGEVTFGPSDKIFAVNFREKVMEQIKERKQELDRKKTRVVIDFSFLRTFIEKGGIVLTTLKCPHRSAPIKMPKAGTETVCEHCGSTVYAQNIFEKVKKLIE